MAKKSRRMRKLEGGAPAAPPRVPYIGEGTAPSSTPATPSLPAARSAVAPATRRARSADAIVARIDNDEMAREMVYVRTDLRRISLLATTLLALLIALSLILPRVLV